MAEELTVRGTGARTIRAPLATGDDGAICTACLRIEGLAPPGDCACRLEAGIAFVDISGVLELCDDRLLSDIWWG